MSLYTTPPSPAPAAVPPHYDSIPNLRALSETEGTTLGLIGQGYLIYLLS